MRIIKQFNKMFGDSVMDGGCMYTIIKKDIVLQKMTPKEIVDKLKFTYSYNGPGEYFEQPGYAVFRKNYIIIRQNWGYDI